MKNLSNNNKFVAYNSHRPEIKMSQSVMVILRSLSKSELNDIFLMASYHPKLVEAQDQQVYAKITKGGTIELLEAQAHPLFCSRYFFTGIAVPKAKLILRR